MILCICGSRNLEDRAWALATIEAYVAENGTPTLVLSGECKGGDQFGAEWAKSKGIEVRGYPALWAKHGNSAGQVRNRAMAKDCTHVLALVRGSTVSKGTHNMITEGLLRDRDVTIKHWRP